MKACRLHSFVLVLAAASAPLSFAACSSSTSAPVYATDDASSSGSSGGSSSSSSGGGSSSGTSSSSGSGSSSGSTHDGGSSSSSGGPGGRVPSQVMFDDAGVPLCGTPCPLSSNQCCVSVLGAATCLAADAGPCPMADALPQADFKCVEKSDCPSNQVCCGYADTTTSPATAGSTCQAVSAGNCAPPASSSKASAQLCQLNSECKSGTSCIWQDCTVGTQTLQLTMCGIQTGAVFNCHAH